jgi:hypothetical protein
MAKLSVDLQHMETIERLYTEAERLIGQMMVSLRSSNSTLTKEYLGGSSEINQEGIEKYLEHLGFLQLSCQANREHVALTKRELKSVDELMSNAMDILRGAKK